MFLWLKRKSCQWFNISIEGLFKGSTKAMKLIDSKAMKSIYSAELDIYRWWLWQVMSHRYLREAPEWTTRSTTRYCRHRGKDIVHNGALPMILLPLRYFPHCFTIPSAEKISSEKKYSLQHDGCYETPIVLSSARSNDYIKRKKQQWRLCLNEQLKPSKNLCSLIEKIFWRNRSRLIAPIVHSQ